MAKKFDFNGVEIATAKYNRTWFFNRAQVGEALGYKSSINYSLADKYPLIEIGTSTYIPFDGLQEALASATGDRKKLAVRFLQEIASEFDINLSSRSTDPAIGELPETAAKWALACVDLKAAKDMLEDAQKVERDLFDRLLEDRKNG